VGFVLNFIDASSILPQKHVYYFTLHDACSLIGISVANPTRENRRITSARMNICMDMHATFSSSVELCPSPLQPGALGASSFETFK
jgi:hypothetical protein